MATRPLTAPMMPMIGMNERSSPTTPVTSAVMPKPFRS
jgi:hypothetical protein